MASTIQADRRDALAEVGRQGFRFALTGGVVALVYVGTTTALAEVVGLGFEVSLAIGFVVALVTHFNLQRMFVWRHPDWSYALRLHHQLARYLAVAGVQYGLTAVAIATLPSALEVSPEVVYLPTVAVISAGNFIVFRSRVFHPEIDRPMVIG
jgi:putative flippase GtrA